MTNTGAALLGQASHFKFGENWLDYARSIDEPRILQATTDLQRLAGRTDMRGLSFLDIGCGSGLHALVAMRMGASRVVGIDLDPDSVAASRFTFDRFAPKAPASFEVRSIFDTPPAQFGAFDIVYSWGVLHHTGDMQRALRCAAALVSENGAFLFALYKKTLFCPLWRVFKRWYSQASLDSQAASRRRYMKLLRLWSELHGRDFDAYVDSYSRSRGMNFYNDVHDWLGGYPYESISPKHCNRIMTGLGFRLDREFVAAGGWRNLHILGSVCDEYAFRRA